MDTSLHVITTAFMDVWILKIDEVANSGVSDRGNRRLNSLCKAVLPSRRIAALPVLLQARRLYLLHGRYDNKVLYIKVSSIVTLKFNGPSFKLETFFDLNYH